MSAAPGSPSFTDAQRSAVERRDADLCVVAGAGSGKTSVLVERFVSLVLGAGGDGRDDEGVHGDRLRTVDRILTLTFTDKAATEMRERAARRFSEEGAARAAAGPPSEAATAVRRFQELRRAVETAWIGTFHGFCARLLKENAVEAGVDPSFSILPEGDAALLLEEAVAAAVERLLAADPGALDGLVHLAEPELEEALPWLLERCRVPGRRPSDALAEARRRPEPGDLVEDLRDALRRLRGGMDGFTPAARQRAESALAAAAALKGVDGTDVHAVAEVAGTIRRSFNLQAKGTAKELLSAVRDGCDGVAALSATWHGAAAADALGVLLDAVDGEVRARRAAAGCLDFADLEERALALLEMDADVRAEVEERFDFLLVDEYQDTSPVQARLLALLRGGRERRHFVVGDPKQAIYGFRGASVQGFLDERKRVGTGGTVVLADNFRSRADILRFSNAVLAPAFADGGDDQVPYEPLVPGVAHGPRKAPSVELIVVAPSAEGETTADLRPREAALLAERLSFLVEGGGLSVTRCGADGAPDGRALRWGDVAVLFRATSDLKIYERALADRDIPCQVLKGRGFYEAREVVDLANLLEALDNPRRDLALAAALRSPFAGLDDDTLLALCTERDRRGGGAVLADLLRDGFLPGGLGRGQGDALRRFAATWASLLADRRRGRLHDLVDRALEETGYGDAVLLRPGGRQAAANLRKVRARARGFEADGLGGLAEFVHALRRLRLREERETEAPVAAGDAVSLLTVHQAKGLEWPLVCVPDLGRGTPAVRGSVLVRDGRAGLRVRTGTDTASTPLHGELKERETAAQQAESVRLLHVALTRAREYLLLSGCTRGASAAGAEPPATRRGTWLDILAAAVDPVAWPAAGESTTATCGGGEDGPAVAVALTVSTAAAVAGPARRAPLSVRHRKRLLAGRGPGAPAAKGTPKGERAAIRGEVDRLVALEGILAAERLARTDDPVPYLLTVSALLDREDDPALYRRRHLLGVPDRRPAALPGIDDVRLDFPFARGDASLGGEGSRRASRAGDDDEVPSGGDDFPGADDVPRWVRGVAVHAALGLLPFDDLGDDAVVAAYLRDRMAEELQRDPPEAAVAEGTGWVRDFRGSPLGRRVFAAARAEPDRVLREVPFLYKFEKPAKGDGEPERLLLRGQVDLLFRDDDGMWVVADYKASPLPKKRGARRRYERQVRLYAEALAEVPGLRPGRALLIPLEGEPVEVALSGPAKPGGP